MIEEARRILECGVCEKNPNYLGSGDHCDAYKMFYNGEYYLVKWYHHKRNLIDKINDAEIHDELYNKAKGILHVPQLVGKSLKERIIITEYIGGELLSDFNVCSIDINILKSAIDELIQTYIQLLMNGLNVDAIKSNLKYFKQRFYLIDFRLKTNEITIGKEVLLIPILLAHDEECLIKLITILLNLISSYNDIQKDAIALVEMKDMAIKNFEQNYGNLMEQNGLNDTQQRMSKYIQFIYKNKRKPIK